MHNAMHRHNNELSTRDAQIHQDKLSYFSKFYGKCYGNSHDSHVYSYHTGYIWASTRENMSSVFANNKDTDQPARMRSLISAFVIPLLESFISRLATRKISIF